MNTNGAATRCQDLMSIYEAPCTGLTWDISRAGRQRAGVT
jgi:hypothetical protein